MKCRKIGGENPLNSIVFQEKSHYPNARRENGKTKTKHINQKQPPEFTEISCNKCYAWKSISNVSKSPGASSINCEGGKLNT